MYVILLITVYYGRKEHSIVCNFKRFFTQDSGLFSIFRNWLKR